MNRRERDELLQFLQPLLRTRATDKDFAAETLILEQCARQPDALYLLVQRAMALQSALHAAQVQLAQRPMTADRHAVAHESGGWTGTESPARDEDGDRGGAWGRGLLTQAGAIGAGVGLGVAAGVVVGGLLLDTLDAGLMGDP